MGDSMDMMSRMYMVLALTEYNMEDMVLIFCQSHMPLKIRWNCTIYDHGP